MAFDLPKIFALLQICLNFTVVEEKALKVNSVREVLLACSVYSLLSTVNVMHKQVKLLENYLLLMHFSLFGGP